MPTLLTACDPLTMHTPPHLGFFDPPAPRTTLINGVSQDSGLCHLIRVSADSVCVPHGKYSRYLSVILHINPTGLEMSQTVTLVGPESPVHDLLEKLPSSGHLYFEHRVV
jgi:hypothetical protein